jgi:hypothetical protein
MNETLSTKGRHPDESYIVHMAEDVPLKAEMQAIGKHDDDENAIGAKTGIDKDIDDCLKKRGSKTVLYQEPQSLPVNSGLTALLYVYTHVSLMFIQRIFFGVLIICAYHQTIRTLVPIVFFLFVFQVVLILKNLYFIATNGKYYPEFKPTYYLNALFAFGMLTIYAGTLLFLNNQLAREYYWLFGLPNILFATLRFFISSHLDKSFTPMALYHMIESVQIVFLMARISNPDSQYSLDSAMTFYWIAASLIGWIAIVFWIVFIVYIIIVIVLLCKITPREADIYILFVGCGFFFLLWNAYCFRYAVWGLYYLFTDNPDIRSGGQIVISNTLYSVAIVTVVFSALSLLTMLTVYCKVRQLVIQKLNSQKNTMVISLASFAKDLHMHIKQESETYFQKLKDQPPKQPAKDEEAAKQNHRDQLCTICYDQKSEVLIDPCGHSGFCANCMTNCLKEKQDCPICRQKVEKAFLIFFDEASNGFMAKGVITFD